MSNLSKVKNAMVNLEGDLLETEIKAALDAGVKPDQIILHGLQEGMKEIGDKFASREYFLPELILSASIMETASAIIMPIMEKERGKKEKAYKVVIGSAKDDVHDIGKNIVGLVLKANGYEVFDLGVDVPADKFVEKAEEFGADVIAISALLSTVLVKVKEAISEIKEEGMKAKILVGGAAFTAESAKQVGADGYGKDAWAAVAELKKILG